MKKPWMILLLLGMIVSAKGQNKDTRLGIAISGILSNWVGNDAEQLSDALTAVFEIDGFSASSFTKQPLMGYSYGVFIEHRISEKIIFQPEVHYFSKGCKFSGLLSYEDYNQLYSFDMELIFNLRYIQMPLLFVYAPRKNEFSTSHTLYAGPFLALLSASRLKVKLSCASESKSEEEELEDIESTEFGFIIGTGLMLSSGVRINLQYQKGVKQVISNLAAYNSVFVANIEFVF